MINYSSKTFKSTSLALLAMVAMLVGSCTKVDDEMGSSLIPENQQMVLKTTTFDGIQTSNYYTDSTRSSNIGALLLGRETSETFGKVEASFFAQYSPYYSSSDIEGANPFGNNPVVDSVVMSLPIVEAFEGDTTVEQKFDIYVVNKSISRDSAYYTNFPYEDYIEDAPLGSFSFAGTYSDNGLSVTIDPSFGAKLLDATDKVYEYDTLFLERFKGMVFVPADDSPEQASIYSLAASSMTMTMYYRNFDSEGEVADTAYMIYTFDDYNYTFNTSINMVKHDYAGTGIEINNDVEQEVTYVQGFGGLATSVSVPESFLEQLRAQVGEGTDYSSIAINKAELVVSTLSENSEGSNEFAPYRLGMYENYAKIKPIIDYNYTYEDEYKMTIPYGGYLEMSLCEYTMDVTTYLSQLVAKNDDSSKDVVLGTTYSSQLQFQEVALNGSASQKPPVLRVTYTLIK